MRAAYIALLSLAVFVIMIMTILLLSRHQIDLVRNPDISDERAEEAQVTYSFVHLGPNLSPILETGPDLYKMYSEPHPCSQVYPSIGNWELAKGVLEDSSLPQPGVTVFQLTCPDGKQEIGNQTFPEEVYWKHEVPFFYTSNDRHFADDLGREIDYIIGGDSSPVSLLKDKFIKMYDTLDENHEVKVATAIGRVFTLQYERILGPSSTIQEAYNALPTTFPGNERHFRNFFKHFGTHYIYEATYGGVYFSLTRNNVTNKVHLGGRNVTDFKSWASTLKQCPAIVSVTLEPLSRILRGEVIDVDKHVAFWEGIQLQRLVNKMGVEARTLDVVGRNPLSQFVSDSIRQELQHEVPRYRMDHVVGHVRHHNPNLANLYLICHTPSGKALKYYVAEGICVNFEKVECKTVVPHGISNTIKFYSGRDCNGTVNIADGDLDSLFRNMGSFTLAFDDDWLPDDDI